VWCGPKKAGWCAFSFVGFLFYVEKKSGIHKKTTSSSSLFQFIQLRSRDPSDLFARNKSSWWYVPLLFPAVVSVFFCCCCFRLGRSSLVLRHSRGEGLAAGRSSWARSLRNMLGAHGGGYSFIPPSTTLVVSGNAMNVHARHCLAFFRRDTPTAVMKLLETNSYAEMTRPPLPLSLALPPCRPFSLKTSVAAFFPPPACRQSQECCRGEDWLLFAIAAARVNWGHRHRREHGWCGRWRRCARGEPFPLQLEPRTGSNHLDSADGPRMQQIPLYAMYIWPWLAPVPRPSSSPTCGHSTRAPNFSDVLVRPGFCLELEMFLGARSLVWGSAPA